MNLQRVKKAFFVFEVPHKRKKGLLHLSYTKKTGLMTRCKFINPFFVYERIKNGFPVYYSTKIFLQ